MPERSLDRWDQMVALRVPKHNDGVVDVFINSKQPVSVLALPVGTLAHLLRELRGWDSGVNLRDGWFYVDNLGKNLVIDIDYDGDISSAVSRVGWTMWSSSLHKQGLYIEPWDDEMYSPEI